jgi:hypothetical protein
VSAVLESLVAKPRFHGVATKDSSTGDGKFYHCTVIIELQYFFSANFLHKEVDAKSQDVHILHLN